MVQGAMSGIAETLDSYNFQGTFTQLESAFDGRYKFDPIVAPWIILRLDYASWRIRTLAFSLPNTLSIFSSFQRWIITNHSSTILEATAAHSHRLLSVQMRQANK
jgi:hypothetical protein